MDFVSLILVLPGIILGLVVHEFSHAWAADLLGDPTPRSQGRLTLNPLKHIDPMGFIFLLVARFGWARPVQCDKSRFVHPALGMSIVALAGPISNLILAFLISLPTYFYISGLPERSLIQDWQYYFASFLDATIRINLGLFIFNLIPIPPLDGSHLWMGLIPDEQAALKASIYRFGALGLFALLILSSVINVPIFGFLTSGVGQITNYFYGLWGSFSGSM